MRDITRLLSQMDGRDPSVADKLLPLVYNELRALAAAKLDHEKAGQTLQATALVHEAYVRLVDVDYKQDWKSRRHFFGAAAEAMRRILVDRARRRGRMKHGGDLQRIDLDPDLIPAATGDHLIEALDDALNRFAEREPVACELVKLRYFAGLSLRDAASALELSPRTADRLWAYSKAWLMLEIQDGNDQDTHAGRGPK
ncbi:MAG: ECF-type sigma factor [Pirellulaceae bacterium]